MVRENLPALTGLRALAAYSVLVAHAFDTVFAFGGGESFLRKYTVGFAYFGMTLFFVLSGFVITYNYRELFISKPWGVAFRQFMIARIARLYPLYLVVLFVSMNRAQWRLFFEDWSALLSFMTLTQSWSNRIFLAFPESWSISAEMFFYLVFSLLALAKMKETGFNARTVYSCSLCALLLLPLYGVFAFKPEILASLGPQVASNGNANPWQWVIYYSPYLRIFEFFIGMCAAWVFATARAPGAALALPSKFSTAVVAGCLASIIAVFVYGVFLYASDSFPSMLIKNFAFAPFLAYIIYHTSTYDSWLTNLLSAKPLIFCGELSYSLYCWQAAVLVMFPNLAYDGQTLGAYVSGGLRVFLLMLALTIFSYGSYHAIEKPSRAALRVILSRWLLPAS